MRVADYIFKTLADKGVKHVFLVTGGGAMLKGLGKLISINTGIPIYIAENPTDCVAIGTGKTLDELRSLKTLFIEPEM